MKKQTPSVRKEVFGLFILKKKKNLEGSATGVMMCVISDCDCVFQ